MDVAATTARFFLAAVVVLVVCRLVAVLLRRIGQPPVIGEMIAGVLLGPSLLGLVLPGVQDTLFPDNVRPMLYVVSHIGLVAFMFESATSSSRSGSAASAGPRSRSRRRGSRCRCCWARCSC